MGISGQLYLKAAEVARLNEAVEALGGSISPDDVAAVQAFNDLVEAIGEKVSAGSKDAIVAARTAYENLTDAQKPWLQPRRIPTTPSSMRRPPCLW